jgi:hypothetical protein
VRDRSALSGLRRVYCGGGMRAVGSSRRGCRGRLQGTTAAALIRVHVCSVGTRANTEGTAVCEDVEASRGVEG